MILASYCYSIRRHAADDREHTPLPDAGTLMCVRILDDFSLHLSLRLVETIGGELNPGWVYGCTRYTLRSSPRARSRLGRFWPPSRSKLKRHPFRGPAPARPVVPVRQKKEERIEFRSIARAHQGAICPHIDGGHGH